MIVFLSLTWRDGIQSTAGKKFYYFPFPPHFYTRIICMLHFTSVFFTRICYSTKRKDTSRWPLLSEDQIQLSWEWKLDITLSLLSAVREHLPFWCNFNCCIIYKPKKGLFVLSNTIKISYEEHFKKSNLVLGNRTTGTFIHLTTYIKAENLHRIYSTYPKPQFCQWLHFFFKGSKNVILKKYFLTYLLGCCFFLTSSTD